MTKEQTVNKLLNANEIANAIFTSPVYGFDDLWRITDAIMREYDHSNISKLKGRIKEYNDMVDSLEKRSVSPLDKNYKDAQAYKATTQFLEAVVAVAEHPDMPGADGFKRTAHFLLYARNNRMDSAASMNFVQQAQSLISDNNIRHRMLYVLSGGSLSEDAKREICKGLVRCEEATTIQDYYNLIVLIKEPETIMRLFEEMERKASADIEAEMSNQPYDVSKIDLVVKAVNSTITNAVRLTNSEQINKWATEQRRKWNMEKIIAGGPNFVKSLPTSTYERFAEVQSELADLRTKEQGMSSTITSLRGDIERYSTQEQSLRAEITKLKAERDAVIAERDAARADLDAMIQASSGVKVGLFGGGAKKLKDIATVIQAKRSEHAGK